MTATISETDLDMTVLDALDFKTALPCEHGSGTSRACGGKAEWILRYACCSATILLCTFHKDIAISLSTKFKYIVHVKCGNLMKVKSFDRI